MGREVSKAEDLSLTAFNVDVHGRGLEGGQGCISHHSAHPLLPLAQTAQFPRSNTTIGKMNMGSDFTRNHHNPHRRLRILMFSSDITYPRLFRGNGLTPAQN